MANRGWFPFRGSLDREIVDLHFVLNTGATGAVGATSAGKGILSCTRNSAGKYTFVLQDKFFAFLDMHAVISPQASGVGTTNKGMWFNLCGLPTMPGNTIAVVAMDQTGAAAADVPDNASVKFTFRMKNAST